MPTVKSPRKDAGVTTLKSINRLSRALIPYLPLFLLKRDTIISSQGTPNIAAGALTVCGRGAGATATQARTRRTMYSRNWPLTMHTLTARMLTEMAPPRQLATFPC